MHFASIVLIVFACITYLSYRLLEPDLQKKRQAPRTISTPSSLQWQWKRAVRWVLESPIRLLYVVLPMALLNYFIVRTLTHTIILAVIWSIIAGALSYFGLSQALYMYRNRLNRQLLDLVNFLAGSIKAGLGLQQAFQEIANNDTLPLASEFGRAVHQWQLGASMEVVLDSLNRRILSPDLQLLSSVLLLNQELGGELSGMLERTATALRERDRLRREVRRSTAQARLTTIIGIVLPCALATFIHILNPAYLKPLYYTNLGLMLLGFGVLLMITGSLIIYRVSQSIGN